MNNPRKTEKAYIAAIKRNAKLKSGKIATLEFYKVVVDDWIGEDEKKQQTILAIYDNIEDALGFVKYWNEPRLYDTNAKSIALNVRLKILERQVYIKNHNKKNAEQRNLGLRKRRFGKNTDDENNQDN